MHVNPETTAILSDLNEPQRRAVTHREGPLLVLAGPGSGKTRVITRRAAYLVHTGVPARNILAITFTNKAADEMKRRIEELGVSRGMWVHTFHALGVRLLREFGGLVGVSPGFSIYDEADRLRVVKEAMEASGTKEVLMRPQVIQSAISAAKNQLRSPAQFAELADTFEQRVVARVYERYEELLRQRNAVDFDDLLMRVALLLRGHADIVERLNIRFQHVLVDEYQDTNHAQYLIARYLSERHRNICVTGDPDQSIYGWRGADISNILDFERDYRDAVVVRLEQNYRSTAMILQAASAVIANNRRRKHKELWTENPAGEPVDVWRFSDEHDEAEQIADTIQRLHNGGRAYSDAAIFYRVNALSRGLEESLRIRGIPYRIARGVEFYNRKEIKDTLGYLRILSNPADEVALLRIINTPTRGIGKTTIERLLAIAEREQRPLLDILRDPGHQADLKSAGKKIRAFVELLHQIGEAAQGRVSEAVSAALTLSGLEAALTKELEEGGEDRLANVQELVTAARRYEEEVEEPTLADFLYRVALVSDQDQVDESAGVVMLMTLHAAKGLEFPVVFMVGLEQGLLPHETALMESVDVEEERRLCFVGITRARERLVLTHARQRMIRGVTLPRAPSQFLRELDESAARCEDYCRAAWDFSGGRRQMEAGEEPDEDGFVALHDHLEPEENQRPLRPRLASEDGTRPFPSRAERGAARGRRKSDRRRRRFSEFGDEEDMRIIDAAADALARTSRYADWQPGTLVRHARYGVGQVVWIRPGGGQTRASIRFPREGEKTFILELAPVEKLER
jgi:DNA helicase-2/ATP-dependent DNA helicase PcrA